MEGPPLNETKTAPREENQGDLSFVGVQQKLREFTAARDWEQFHDPKNLSMALAAEAGELLEVFQWLTPEQSKAVRGSEKDLQLVREELADVLIYAFRLADILGIDLPGAVEAKIRRNEEKYPPDRSRGNAVKYSRREP